MTEAEKYERRDKAGMLDVSGDLKIKLTIITVLYLRHRLQKGFLMRDQAPKEDEMSSMNDFFNQIEGFSNLEPAIIRGTKIYKVLRGIIKLSSIPKEEEFQFKKRSNDLLALWNDALGSKGDDKDDDKEDGEKMAKVEETVEATESKEASVPVEDAAVEKDVVMDDVEENKAEETVESAAEPVEAAEATETAEPVESAAADSETTAA
jgi:hypothetical protein